MAMGAPGMLGTVRAVLYADSAHFRYGCRQASDELRLLAQETRLHTQSLVATGAALGAAIALPLGRFTKNAAMVFGGFELGMTKVGNVAKLTGMEIEDMTKKVLDLSKAYNIDPTDIARGAYSLAQAAIVDPKLLGAATEQAARLTKASGFEISTDQAATAIGQLMQAFSVPLNEVGALTDMIVRTQELSIAKWSEMISNMGKASGVFSTVFDDNKRGLLEMMTLMAVVTQGGERMTRASTGVRNIIERIIKEGKKPDSMFFQMANEKGYENAVEMLKAEGVVKMLQEIAEYSGFAADEMMAAGFQKRELTAALLALRDQGVNMKGVQDQLANSAGTADFAISRLSKTQKELFDSFSTTKARLMISFGDSFKAIWASIVPVLNAVMEGFISLPDSVKRLVALTAIITALSSALLLLRGALTSIRLLGQTGAFGGIFGAAGKAGSPWKSMLLTMTGGMAGAGGASFGNLQGIFSSRDATIAKDLKESVIALRSAKALDPAAAKAVQAKFWKSYGAVLAATPIRDAATKKATSDFVTGRGSPTSILIPGVGRVLRRDAAEGMSQTAISSNVSQGVTTRNMAVPTALALSAKKLFASLGAGLKALGVILAKAALIVGAVVVAFKALGQPFTLLGEWIDSIIKGITGSDNAFTKFIADLFSESGIILALKSLLVAFAQVGNGIGGIIALLLVSLKQLGVGLFNFLADSIAKGLLWLKGEKHAARYIEPGKGFVESMSGAITTQFEELIRRIEATDAWTMTGQKTAKTPEEIAEEKREEEEARRKRTQEEYAAWYEALNLDMKAANEELAKKTRELYELEVEDATALAELREESKKPINETNDGWASASVAGSVEAWNSSFESFNALQDTAVKIKEKMDENAKREMEIEARNSWERSNLATAIEALKTYVEFNKIAVETGIR